jgi:hypothetical protein
MQSGARHAGSRTAIFLFTTSAWLLRLCTALHVRGLTAVEAAVSCCELCGFTENCESC